MHLLIPFACLQLPAARAALDERRLSNLHRLLRELEPMPMELAGDTSLSLPHERAFALACGFGAPDGLLPLAAHARALAGHSTGSTAWAWVSPVHWDVAAAHIGMANPATLQLHADESLELLQAMQPYFTQDGITLHYESAARWWAGGPTLGAWASASIDRVLLASDISRWMPAQPALRRLQNEMQMLLYTHPVNAARERRGVPVVNSFWLHGSGVLPPAAQTTPAPGLVLDDSLRQAALAHDAPAWAAAWAAVDAGPCAALWRALQAGATVQLTLCGERAAQTFGPRRHRPLQRLVHRLRAPALAGLWERL